MFDDLIYIKPPTDSKQSDKFAMNNDINKSNQFDVNCVLNELNRIILSGLSRKVKI